MAQAYLAYEAYLLLAGLIAYMVGQEAAKQTTSRGGAGTGGASLPGSSAPPSEWEDWIGDKLSEEQKERVREWLRHAWESGTFAESIRQARTCGCRPAEGCFAPSPNMAEQGWPYQMYVTGFPKFIEWLWSGIFWDGFQPGICTLLEAKGRYAFLYDKLKVGDFDVDFGRQAQSQGIATYPYKGVHLQWHFLEESMRVMCELEFKSNDFTAHILCVHNPMP